MSKEIRVLIVDLSKKFGGASVRALTLADHLKPWEVAIAGLENGPVIKMAGKRNIPVRIVGRKRTDPMIPWRVKDVIRRDQFQVIDTQNIPSKFWGSFATLLTDVAFVSTLNSSYEEEFGKALRGRIYTQLDRWTNFNVDRYIAVSRGINQSLLKAGIPGSDIDLITNVVDVSHAALVEDRNLMRRSMGIPENATLCVSVGRLVWAKGHEDFIRAFALAAGRIKNAYAVIVGGGALYPALMEQIREAGLEDRIKLVGQCDVDTTWSIMRASDVFALPSRSEGVPYALLEAAAFALPILSTNCGGIPEVFSDNVDALLVPVGNLSAISGALIRLCEDRELAARLAARAREKVEREYSLSAQIAAVRQAYTKALAHKEANRALQGTV
jgi:glycosyltransferase involved in cell wall biosynthesis